VRLPVRSQPPLSRRRRIDVRLDLRHHANGAAYDKEQYLAHSIPKIEGEIAFDDLVVTRNADIVVTRMRLKIREHLDGKRAESGAPQLIVFRVTPHGWQVVASANFAKLLN
jgi:hypothetical protein